MKCYLQAMKNDPENFNVIRDLSYLQLYLRQYNSFLDSAKKSVEVRGNLLLNWATYAFANYLVIEINIIILIKKFRLVITNSRLNYLNLLRALDWLLLRNKRSMKLFYSKLCYLLKIRNMRMLSNSF